MREAVRFQPAFPRGTKLRESILRANKRLNIWEGSVRSGKTVSSIFRWLKFLVDEAPSEGSLIMTGKTNRTLERNIINPIIDLLKNKNVKYNRGTGELKLLGRTIDIIGANDERAQEKIRGSTVSGAYGDELTLWPESYFKMLLSRLSVRGAKFFGTTNPDSPYHWLQTDYLSRQAELNMAVFHFTLDDNTFLDRDYVASLKKEYTGLWYKRFILGLWVLAEGAIYDMFDPDRHVIDVQAMLQREYEAKKRAKPAFRSYFIAADYGTNNPCTFGLYGYDKGLPVYLVKEYYYDSVATGRQKTDSQYADDFDEFAGDVRSVASVYVDPSALSFISELRHRGWRVNGANNDVLDGIRFVGKLLSSGNFFIDKSCTHTQNEFTAYVWDAKAQQRGLDEPLKMHDHAMDRNRYGLMSHFFKKYPVILKGVNYK